MGLTSAGSTSRPEGEQATGHAGAQVTGEASPAALANLPPHGGTATNTPDVSPLVPIVRCTCRIQLDVAELAVDRQEHIKKRCGGAEGGCHACEMYRDLKAAQQAAVTAINAATRAHWRADADLIDRFLLTKGRAPKGAEWRAPLDAKAVLSSAAPGLPAGVKDVIALKIVNSKGNLYTYPLVRAVAPTLSSQVATALATRAQDKWRQLRFDALVRQSVSPPHFRTTMPLPIPRQAFRLTHDHDDFYKVSFSLLAGGEGRYALTIRARDQYMRAVLGELVGKQTKMGEVQITQDRLRPGRWYVRIAYTRKVPKRVSDVAVAVHPGLIRFVQATSSNGGKYHHEGHDIEAYLRQIQRRRREFQNDSKASGRWGHGRKRTLKPIKFLEGKGDRWRDNKIQYIARRVAKFARDMNASIAYMPDFSGVRDGLPENLKGGKSLWDRIQSWPYFRQQQAISSCLEEYGIETVIIPAARTADTCPKCLHSDPNNIDLKRRLLRCVECGHREVLDVACCLNYLRIGEQLRSAKSGASDSGALEGPIEEKKGGARKAVRKRSKSGPSGGRRGNGH